MEATTVKITLCPFNLGSSCSPVGRKISKQKTNVISVFGFVPCSMSANVCRFKQFQPFSPLRGAFPVSLISPLPTENVTEIKTNIFVTSFGPVSDTEMVS